MPFVFKDLDIIAPDFLGKVLQQESAQKARKFFFVGVDIPGGIQ